MVINNTIGFINLTGNYSGQAVTTLSMDNIIKNYCFDLTKNNIYFLIFLVGLWFVRYAYKLILKYKYHKKNIIVPKITQMIYEIIDETLDLLQSTYILIILVLMLV